MNVLLFADPRASQIKTMTDTIDDVHWQLAEAVQQPTDNQFDYWFYVISPIEVAEQQIPACIPELINDSNKRPKKTLFCYLSDGDDYFFTQHQTKSLKAIGQMVESNGAIWLKSLPTTSAQWAKAIANGVMQ